MARDSVGWLARDDKNPDPAIRQRPLCGLTVLQGLQPGDRLLIGFAAETENLIGEARRKMISKQCDMLVANQVNREGLGFEADQNEVDMITRSGRTD